MSILRRKSDSSTETKISFPRLTTLNPFSRRTGRCGSSCPRRKRPAKRAIVALRAPVVVAERRLFAREPDIAVAFHARDFAPKPMRWLEFSTGGLTWEFHFGDDEPFVLSAVNVYLDHEILPRDLVTRFL